MICITAVITPCLYRFIRLKWRWHRVKKAGANLQKCMDDFFSNIPPRESELCRDCKYSEVSNNNGNLLCLHEKSRHFGEAIPLEADRRGFCHFERKTDIASDTSGQENEKEAQGCHT